MEQLARAGPSEERGDPGKGVRVGEGAAAGERPLRRLTIEDRVAECPAQERQDLVQAGHEERVIRAQHRLLGGSPIQDHGDADRSVVEELRRDDQVVHPRSEAVVPQAQRHPALGDEQLDLVPRQAAMPDQPGRAGQRPVEERRVARLLARAVDLVADHVELEAGNLTPELLEEADHLADRVERAELARIDQAGHDPVRIGPPGRAAWDGRRQEDRLAPGGGHDRLGQCPHLFRLGNEVARAHGDLGQVAHMGRRLRIVLGLEHIRAPQPSPQARPADGRLGDLELADQDHVERLLLVEPLDQVDGLVRREPVRPDLAADSPLGRHELDPGQAAQEASDHVARLGRAEGQDDLCRRADVEGLGDGLDPDRRAVDRVQVGRRVEQDPGHRAGQSPDATEMRRTRSGRRGSSPRTRSRSA